MVLAAFLIMVVGAFLAMSFNTGHGVAVRGELQNAVDSAALAGAREINGSMTGLDAATRFANDFARRHVTDVATGVEAERIEFGNWDPTARTWTRFDPAPENLFRINAVRVNAARQAGAPGGGALPAFFGRAFLNRDTLDVSADAIAFAGGPCPDGNGCNSPFIIRYGCLVRGDLRCDAPYVVGLSSAGVDSAGFSDMNPQDGITNNASASSQSICQGLMDTTPVTCTMGGSQMHTTNGNQMNAMCRGMTLCQRIKALYPPDTTMRIPVVMYDDGDVTACNGGQYGGVATIVSTMKMRVDGVWCDSDGGRLGLCAPYATGNCVALTTLCEDTNDVPGACVNLGTTTAAPKLGR
jgi:hypothetical protein